MSDIQPMMTKQAKVSASTAQGGVTAKGNGFFSLAGGLAFWDMLAPQGGVKPTATIAPLKTAQAASAETLAARASETALSGDEQLDLAAAIDEALLALLDGKEEDEEGGVRPLSLLDILQAVNGEVEVGAGADEKALFQKVVERLAAGLPLESRGEQDLDALIDRLKKQSEFLKTGKINDEDVPITLLIALGVSPAELTQITAKIAKLEDKLGRRLTVEDIIAGIGGLTDAKKKDEEGAVVFALGDVPANVSGMAQGARDPNKMGEAGAADPLTPVFSPEGEQAAAPDEAGRRERTGPAGAAKDAALHGLTAVSSGKASAGAQAGQVVPASAMAANNAAGSGQILFDAAQVVTADGTLLLDGMEIQTGIPLTQATLAAHATTAATQAGQAHPATQMVASALQRMTRNGGPAELTIHMDPPELGRVIAKMQFGKDKTVKTVLTIEKPETYHMLIRDAASLERALQNAGLTADSASLSFELAQDGSAFNSNNNGEGGGEPHGAGTGTDLASDNGQETIAATMTWQVDPDTGYVRYDLLA